jgi:inward rectifier potassium channel
MGSKPSFDPGLTQQYTKPLGRSITASGDFNVRRRGTKWRDIHPYLTLITLSWPVFSAFVLGVFVLTNLLFASVYCLIGVDHLKGADGATPALRFLDAFFFSTHTLTTVGYGNIYPSGIFANSVAAIEALLGLLGFAIITGILFGRFSRPSARVGFSDNVLVTPYNDGLSLQFRLLNRRRHNLIEVSARVLLITVEMVNGALQRKFAQLELERDQIIFLALTWTVVHPVTGTSPLAGKTAAELAALQAELLINIKAYDETFGQSVSARWSYRVEDFIWGAKFSPAFDVEADGALRLEVDRVSSFEPRGPIDRL